MFKSCTCIFYPFLFLLFRNRVRDIKDSFDRLHRLSLTGPNSEEFVESKVQEIWIKAQETNFSKDELVFLHVRNNKLFKILLNDLYILRTFRMN